MLAVFEDLKPRWGERYGSLQVWYTLLTYIDEQVRRMLNRLDQLGLGENTVAVLSSDNGPESGLVPFVSHYGNTASGGPFRGLKRGSYEGGIREPFIVRWKCHPPADAVNSDTVFSGVDRRPSDCRLACVEAPPNIGGEDVAGSLRGEPVSRTRPLMWESRFPVCGHVLHKIPMLAIRSGRWKLLMNPDCSRLKFYDLPMDPEGMDGLSSLEPEIV